LWESELFDIPQRALTGKSEHNTPLRIHHGAGSIYKIGNTGVYTINGYPSLVMKYYSYCYNEFSAPIDPMVVENYFMERLGPIGLSPKVYYLSPAIQFIDSEGNKIEDDGLGVIPEEGKVPDVYCTLLDDSKILVIVRYMIMVRVVKAVFNQIYTSGRLPFIDAIRYGIQMIRLLEQLHGMNIIHGDAHMGNFASRLDEPEKLIMIDFGRARIIGPVEVAAAPSPFCDLEEYKPGSAVPFTEYLIHPYTGKWEMRYCEPAFRDDVYRVIQGVAMIMHGIPHLEFLKYLPQKDPLEYRRIKNEAAFWNIPKTKLLIPNEATGANEEGDFEFEEKDFEFLIEDCLPENAKKNLDEIVTLLNAISEETSREHPENPYQRPDYGLIIGKFEKILVLLNQ